MVDASDDDGAQLSLPHPLSRERCKPNPVSR